MNMTLDMKALNSSTRIANPLEAPNHQDHIYERIEAHRAAAIAFEQSPETNNDLTPVDNAVSALLRKEPKTNAGWAALIRYAQSTPNMSVDDGDAYWWEKLLAKLADRLERTPDKKLNSRSDVKCPVAELAAEAEALLRANRILDNRRSEDEPGDKAIEEAILDRLDTIKEEASYLLPRSAIGATFQLILADAESDLVFNNTFHSDFAKGQHERLVSRLHYAARSFLDAQGGVASLTEVRNYYMVDYLNPRLLLEKATKGKMPGE